MKLFNPIHRDYKAPADLGTLEKTYNTLEQGHREAVRAASELETAMANLDLNENESEWRQQKIDDIRTTIQQNTLHGNAYGALDNIIAKAGNIASDQGMIGRLNAQKDYKAYMDRLENRNDIPEDYKEYFRENNPYRYQDQVDKNGKIIGGTKWQPIEREVSTVDLSKLIIGGINLAAKESGGGTVTRWLDENGNPTNDPAKAYDGEIYDERSSSYQRLGKDKIIKGIQAYIETTPGAKESLNQDYKIAKWKHDKLVKSNDGNTVVSDITDNNGILLNEAQYLAKRINPAVQAAEYNNVTSNTKYGRGLATYKAGKMKELYAAQKSQNRIDEASSGTNYPIQIEIDPIGSFITSKNEAANRIQALYKEVTGKNIIIDNNNRLKLNTDSITGRPKAELIRMINAYNDAHDNITRLTNGMSKSDKNLSFWAADMQNGGVMVKGRSKEDDAVINKINSIYGSNGSAIKVTLDDEAMKQYFVESFGNTDYRDLGISVQGNDIIIPKKSMYSVPMIFSTIKKAENRRNKGFGNTIVGALKGDRYKVQVLDNNNKEIAGTSYSSDVQMGSKQLGMLYDKSFKVNDNIYKKYSNIPKTMELSRLNLGGTTFAENEYFHDYNLGLLDGADYKRLSDRDKELVERDIKMHGYTQRDIYINDEKESLIKKVSDSKKRLNLGEEIVKAVDDKRISYSPTFIPSLGAGYNITITPKTNSEGKTVGDTRPMSIFIPGLREDAATRRMMNDPKVRAFNTVSVVSGSKSFKNITDKGRTPVIGNVGYQGYGDGTFDITFNDNVIKGDITTVSNLQEGFNNFLDIKESGIDITSNERARNAIASSAKSIGASLGIPPSTILDMMINELGY